VPFAQIPLEVVGSAKHLALTKQAAQKSLVLLKNQQLLPLTGHEKIALIGPNANNPAILVGNYHGTPVNPVTIKQALEQRLGANQVSYHPGSSLTEDIYTHHQAISAEHFFHTDHDGNTQAGLMAEYFPDAHFGRQPAFRQVEANIDTQWLRSPIDNSAEQEFAIKWQGILKPTTTANYRFDASNVSFTLNGEAVSGPIKLDSGVSYRFNAEAKFHHLWHSNVIQPSARLAWLNDDRDLTAEALHAAKNADVVVFVGGISANLEGEEMPLELDGFSHGDRTHLKLPRSQENLLKALAATGKPIVFVNMSGSAMAINWQQQNLAAIIQGFYPGEATGSALTGLLYGDYSPSGKLPVTFYKSVNDLPEFTDYSMNNRTYKYFNGEVLYPFGYGLSYADIHYSEPKYHFNPDANTLTLSAIMSNHSNIDSEAVVQVYLTLLETPITTPNKQLLDFKRVNITAKGSKNISFEIDRQQLSYINEQGERERYSGPVQLTLGSGQGIKLPKHQYATFTITVP